MSTSFEPSMWFTGIHAVLILAITGVSSLLSRSLRRSSELRELYVQQAKQLQPTPVAFLPTFDAPELLCGARVSSSDFLGAPAVLLFLRPENFETLLVDNVITSASALSSKVNGALYVICSGSSRFCQERARRLRDRGLLFKAMLDDSDGLLALRFGVIKTPAAIEIDGKGQMIKKGFQVYSHLAVHQKGIT